MISKKTWSLELWINSETMHHKGSACYITEISIDHFVASIQIIGLKLFSHVDKGQVIGRQSSDNHDFNA